MKRLATIILSVSFLVSGVILSQFENKPQNTVNAAPIVLTRPTLPLDLQLGKRETKDSFLILRDTVMLRDTVQVVKYKYRTKKVPAKPDTIINIAHDTLYVPALYVVIQAKEESDTIVKPVE